MAKLKSSILKNNNNVMKMKDEMKQQCKYVASLENQIASLTKVTKKQKQELEVLQVGLNEISTKSFVQYSNRKFLLWSQRQNHVN